MPQRSFQKLSSNLQKRVRKRAVAGTLHSRTCRQQVWKRNKKLWQWRAVSRRFPHHPATSCTHRSVHSLAFPKSGLHTEQKLLNWATVERNTQPQKKTLKTWCSPHAPQQFMTCGFSKQMGKKCNGGEAMGRVPLWPNCKSKTEIASQNGNAKSHVLAFLEVWPFGAVIIVTF